MPRVLGEWAFFQGRGTPVQVRLPDLNPGDHLLGPLGFDFAQHRQTLRPTVDGI